MGRLKRLESKLEGRTEVFYTAWRWLTENSIMVSYKGHHFNKVLMAPSHLLSTESGVAEDSSPIGITEKARNTQCVWMAKAS